jgi:predicted N-acetyltransferase YhbS
MAMHSHDFTIRKEFAKDGAAREALLDLSLGQGRFAKASERLREGRRAADELSFVAADRGCLVGTVRLWNVTAGPGRKALLLGPLAVHPDFRNRGIGGDLMRHALDAAKRLGHQAVLLVGDAPYYARFGFAAAPTADLWLPGLYDARRFLALELQPGALTVARGLVSATGRLARKPALRTLVARLKAETPKSPALRSEALWPATPLSHAA